MKVWLYGEHCVMAGHECFDVGLIERESDDVWCASGSAAELLEIAGHWRARREAYAATVADTLYAAVAGWALVGASRVGKTWQGVGAVLSGAE